MRRRTPTCGDDEGPGNDHRDSIDATYLYAVRLNLFAHEECRRGAAAREELLHFALVERVDDLADGLVARVAIEAQHGEANAQRAGRQLLRANLVEGELFVEDGRARLAHQACFRVVLLQR